MKYSILALFGLCAAPASAITIISDNFDSGTISNDWAAKFMTTAVAGGVGGTGSYASIPATVNGLGDTIGGADSFVIDYYFRVQNSTDRQFNLGVSSASVSPNPGAAAINLRYQSSAGGWALYGSSWNTISLGAVTPGEWYHMQVEGQNWGTAGANYTLRLSDAGGTAFTSSFTSTIVQNGSIAGPFTYGTPPANFSGTAQSFIFSTLYGGSPGFDLDNVVVTANLIPEPSTLPLMGAALLFMGRRRRG